MRGLPNIPVSGIIMKTTRLPSRESWYLPGNKKFALRSKIFVQGKSKTFEKQARGLKDEG
jgi:hypothetical protein